MSLAAPSLTDIMADLPLHDAEMGGTIDGMEHALGEIEHCAFGAVDGTRGMAGQMRAEMIDHRAGEVNPHAERLGGIMVTMGDMLKGAKCI